MKATFCVLMTLEWFVQVLSPGASIVNRKGIRQPIVPNKSEKSKGPRTLASVTTVALRSIGLVPVLNLAGLWLATTVDKKTI